MKNSLIAFSLLCLIAVVSCTHHDDSRLGAASPTPTPSQVPSPNAGSPESAKAESGDTSPPDFEGTFVVSTKRAPAKQPPALLKAIRTGTHDTFDRVVFEFEGDAVPGYRVEYVDKPASCGSGDVVQIGGKAFLVVSMTPANAHTGAGLSTIPNQQQITGLPVLRELKLICDFEAEVSWVLGLSARNGYRVVELKNPARLVVDIAQKATGE